VDKPTGYEVWRGLSAIDGAPVVVVVTVRSLNRKTGAMLQAWILRDDIDPVVAVRDGSDESICGSCYHRGSRREGRKRSCYVNVGQAPLSVFRAWKRGRYPVATLADVVAWHPVPLRIGAYGDPGAVPAAVWSAAAAVPRTGYTHQWRTRPDLRALCMASVDSVAEAAEAAAQGWRAFLVVPDDAAMPFTLPGEEGTRRVVPCPAVTFGAQCADCRICDGAAAEGPGMRKPHVAIAAHGAGAGNFAPLQPGNP
jgi:hypothetical protein